MRQSFRWILSCSCVLGLATSYANAQNCRMFLQQIGQDPVAAGPGPVTIAANPGDVISLGVYIECTVSQQVSGTQTSAPCSATCSDISPECTCAGSVDFTFVERDPAPVSQSCVGTGPNTGNACTINADCKVCVGGLFNGFACLAGDSCPGGGVCASASYCHGEASPYIDVDDPLFLWYGGSPFLAYDNGTCGGAGGLPRVAVAPAASGMFINVTTPKYVGEFIYTVSAGARGAHTITIPNEPDSAMRDAGGMPVVFSTDGAVIEITCGQCCAGNPPLCTYSTDDACAGSWDPAKTCADSCHCSVSSDCNDGNACTSDFCDPVGAGDGCSHGSLIGAGMCCDPADGVQLPIDDGNVCTDDSCNTATGEVTHDGPANNGDACADDGNPCTLDRCNNGACAHDDITLIPCVADADCTAASGGASNTCGGLAAGLCDCVANPPVSIVCDDGDKPNGECFNDGDKVTMKVVLGSGTLVINGAQFELDYNPACLEFNFATPGSVCDASSPFTTEIFEQVNESTGSIFYAVGIDLFQNGGSNDGGVLACLSFNKICSAACEDCNVCFVADNNPQHTYLSGPGGQLVVPDFPNSGCGCEVRCNGTNSITVPEGVAVNADCDSPTAIVTWASPAAASNSCDGAIALTCTCDHDNPLVTDCNHLTANGGEFPQGTAEFCCTGTDECGLVVNDCWTVYVSDQTTMDVVIQLSPTMTPNQFTRCIEFGFYANCVEAPEIFKEEIVFGPPYDFPGHATYDIKVPKGQYECITARDQAHTLRSASSIECLGNGHLSAEFKGDPFFGGNWLIGGNLDGSHVIDILDFGVLVSLYLKDGDVNNTCDEIKADGYHDADINADGNVDALDYTFIQGNFLLMDKDICGCDFPGAGAPAAGITSITVQELRAMGLGDLAAGDVNHDGVLDTNDMEAFQQGLIPAPAHNNPPKKASRR